MGPDHVAREGAGMQRVEARVLLSGLQHTGWPHGQGSTHVCLVPLSGDPVGEGSFSVNKSRPALHPHHQVDKSSAVGWLSAGAQPAPLRKHEMPRLNGGSGLQVACSQARG